MYGVMVSNLVLDWAAVLESGEDFPVAIETVVALVSPFDVHDDSVVELDLQLSREPETADDTLSCRWTQELAMRATCGWGVDIIEADDTLSCLWTLGLAMRATCDWGVDIIEGLGGTTSSDVLISVGSIPGCLGEKQRKWRRDRSMAGFIVYIKTVEGNGNCRGLYYREVERMNKELDYKETVI